MGTVQGLLSAGTGTAAQRHQLGWRLIRHHLVLALLGATACALIIAVLPGQDNKFRLSMATGYVGLAFLAATLMIGPLKVLRRRPRPLSDDLRRDVGIWAAIVSVAHVLVGIQIHMGSPWLYFLYGAEPRPRFWPLPVRVDLFGIANHAGIVATLILVLLLVLSNDLSMRSLGNRWWKRLQQLNYALLVLVVLHGILYQRIEDRDAIWVILFWVVWGVAVILQFSGFRGRSARMASKRAPEPSSGVVRR